MSPAPKWNAFKIAKLNLSISVVCVMQPPNSQANFPIIIKEDIQIFYFSFKLQVDWRKSKLEQTGNIHGEKRFSPSLNILSCEIWMGAQIRTHWFYSIFLFCRLHFQLEFFFSLKNISASKYIWYTLEYASCKKENNQRREEKKLSSTLLSGWWKFGTVSQIPYKWNVLITWKRRQRRRR